MKKILLSILAVLMLMSGCAAKTEVKEEPMTEVQLAFEQFLTDEYIDTVSSDALTLHYSLVDPSVYGIEQPELTDRELLGKLYKDIAISAGRLDKDEETVSYLEKAVEILKQSDNPVAYLQSVNSLAYAYGKAGNHSKQKEIARDALDSYDYTGHPDNYVRILNNLADS